MTASQTVSTETQFLVVACAPLWDVHTFSTLAQVREFIFSLPNDATFTVYVQLTAPLTLTEDPVWKGFF